MSIRNDKKFMELLGKYSFRLIDISELLDYIDENYETIIDEELPNISFEEMLRTLPDVQRKLNQRAIKIHNLFNDDKEKVNE